MLHDYLIKKTKEKSTFSFRGLKKMYPESAKEIDKYRFIGLIEPVDVNFPDTVRAHIYE